MGERAQLFDEPKQLSLDKLIDGYDEDDDFNTLGQLALDPDMLNWHIPRQDISDTGNPTTDQQIIAQGNKRARISESQISSTQLNPGSPGLEGDDGHAQNAPKKAKNASACFKQSLSAITTNTSSLSNYVPGINSQPSTVPNVKLSSSVSRTVNSQDLLNTARLDNSSQSLNNFSWNASAVSSLSSSGFNSHSGGNSQVDFTEAFAATMTDYSDIFTSPVITTPKMARLYQQPDASNFLVPTEENQKDGLLVPFQDTDSLAPTPMFPHTTGIPNNNPNALHSNHQRQGTHQNHIEWAPVGFPQTREIHETSPGKHDPLLGNHQRPQVTHDKLFSQNFPQSTPPAAIREPSPGPRSNHARGSYLQNTNVPHIVVPTEMENSPQIIDAVSPLSSPGTGYSSFRSPRSPSNKHVTKASTTNAFCEVTNPRQEYDKIQKKFLQGPRRSEQRIQNGVVRLKMLTKIPLEDPPVNVFVSREPMVAQKQCQEHPEQFTMEQVRIPDVRTWLNDECVDINYPFCYNSELDLDSVYLTNDDKEVYKLVKSKGAVNNLFQLWLMLLYSSGYQETVMTYEFVLKSGRTPAQQEHQMDGGSGIRDTIIGPKSNVSCKYLQAETAKITNIHCEYIQTENHDIAYFMRVQCKDESKPTDLEKGDVVAFLEDDEGDTYIDFLTSDNAHEARLAGVISRTAFFQGRRAICDPDHVDSDLVCIIGEVDVKVHGKVNAGDLIYTSNCLLRRGTAVARHPLEPELHSDDSPMRTLLGMAMESYSDEDIKLVRCLVSVVLGISDLHQRQTLEELRLCNDKILKMQRCLKGIWKKILLFLLFLVLVVTACYLFLAPNSPYLIMQCEKGCPKNSEGSCSYLKFNYFPHESQEYDEIVGIYFKWQVLKEKLGLNFNKCPNGTDFRYYLNKNRCVTGGIRVISSWINSTPQVPRVNVLAVKSNCSYIFYHSARDGWVAYNKRRIKVKTCHEY